MQIQYFELNTRFFVYSLQQAISRDC